MLQIDSELLNAFYKETYSFLCGSRVQKIQQPTRREIILHLRNQGKSEKLYININPSFHHICLMNKNNELKRNIEIPKQPPMFCMLLRKHMEGAKIIKINKPIHERIIELTFENYNELGDRIEECLAIELMGKHSNIVLYNTDTNIIIGCAHNVGVEKSKERELSGGLPYIYPPKQNKKDLLLTKYNQFKASLLKSDLPIKKVISEQYFSLSQITIEEICEINKIDTNTSTSKLEEKQIQILFVCLHELLAQENKKYYTNQDFSKYSCVKKLEKEYKNINNLIDDYFAYNIEKSLTQNIKQSLTTKIYKEIKKQLNTLKNQEKLIDKKDKMQLYMLKGNLLTANAYSITKTPKNISLLDYETNQYIEIELEENLSIIDNAKKYFNLYNKTKRALLIAEELSQKTNDDIRDLNQLLYEIENTNSLKELIEISAEINNEKENKKTTNKKEINLSIEKLNIDGFDIYIGKNSKQNDYLYSKISTPDDLWFHAFNTPGSHIIAKAQNSQQKLNDATLLKIAQIAKKYSSAKDSTKTAIIYTQRKYIKRPNNTKSGLVVYKNEKEIVVN